MNKKKWLILAIFLMSLITFLIIFNYWNTTNTTTISKNINEKEEKKVYKHILPERISKDDYFKWEFISNEVVSVYPRRTALIKDILVDVGDKVYEGQTLAILFTPWIDWEWVSNINLRNTIISSKNNLLEEIKKVKYAKINELDQKITEKQIILQETINNFDSKISQIWDNNTLWWEYQVQLKWLENLQKNLDNAIFLKNKLLKESYDNISQKEQLLSSKIDEISNKIIPIIYVWNEDELDYFDINITDFSDEFWAKTSISDKNDFVMKLKNYNKNYKDLDLEKKYEKLLEINNLLIKLLQNTLISPNITEKTIKTHILNINTYNTSLISENEIFNDSKNMYNVLEISQKEKIENIESQISKKENEISLLWTKSISVQSEKRLAVEQLKASIETLKKSKDLLIANENKDIINLENEISIAKANLNVEYIKSSNYKIISPFSWIISKRWINIWDNIQLNTEAFRITWVNTTLSKITKKEVKFYVPENIKENLSIWKEITFSLWNNKESNFIWTIYRISPEVDEETFNIIVQAKVDENINFPNKTTLRVKLETKEETFKIPSSTIYNKEDKKIVYYKKDNGKIWVLDINIISDDWEYSLVSWNITDNLKIVTTPIFIK